MAPAEPQRQQLRVVVSAVASPVDNAERLLNYVQVAYPELLGQGTTTADSAPFRYRFYPGAGIYVGVVVQDLAPFALNDVYVLGGPFGGLPVRVGKLSDFIAQEPLQGFVQVSGGSFSLNGSAFRVAGANAAQSVANIDRSGMRNALALARAMGANTVRIFAGSEMGTADGSTVPTLGTSPQWRPYFQSWDSTKGTVVFNHGPNGLQLLDEVVFVARELGLRVIVNLVDNWQDFYGGANQYVLWHGAGTHAAFFTNTQVKASYRAWARAI